MHNYGFPTEHNWKTVVSLYMVRSFKIKNWAREMVRQELNLEWTYITGILFCMEETWEHTSVHWQPGKFQRELRYESEPSFERGSQKGTYCCPLLCPTSQRVD